MNPTEQALVDLVRALRVASPGDSASAIKFWHGMGILSDNAHAAQRVYKALTVANQEFERIANLSESRP